MRRTMLKQGDEPVVVSHAEHQAAELGRYEPKLVPAGGRNRIVEVDANLERLVP